MHFATKILRRKSKLSAAVGIAAILLAAGCAPQSPIATEAIAPASTPDRTVLLSVPFAFDSHRLQPESYGQLDNLAAAMLSQELSGYRFQVDGHTDRAGRFGYNIALSRLRADAVVNYLTARGVPRGLMFAQGFGYAVPADPVNPYSPANRRVEVTSIR